MLNGARWVAAFGLVSAFASASGQASSPEVNDSTRWIPATFTGVKIDSLIASMRQPPKGEYESTYRFHQRLGIGREGPLLLARIPAEDTLCGPMTRYDADPEVLKAALTQIAGVIGVKCGRGIWGVSSQDADLSAIAWVPLGADTAEQARKRLRYWLAFRPSATIERGNIWHPFPKDSSIEGIVASSVAIWVTDSSGQVVHKEALQPLPAELQIWAGGSAADVDSSDARLETAAPNADDPASVSERQSGRRRHRPDGPHHPDGPSHAAPGPPDERG